MILALLAFLPKLIVELKERRGVAGLISIIAIVLVFGIAATAFLAITSQQTSLANSITATSNVQNDRISEKLVISQIGCQWNNPPNGLADVTVRINNNWSGSSLLDSILFTNSQNVTDAKYIPDLDKKILSLQQSPPSPAITIQDVKINRTSTEFADRVLLITELGNKFVGAHTFNNPPNC